MNIENITSDKMGLSINGMQMQIEVYEKEIQRLNNIINELEKWLKEKQALYGINQQGFSWGVAGDCLDKLKELKERKYTE